MRKYCAILAIIFSLNFGKAQASESIDELLFELSDEFKTFAIKKSTRAPGPQTLLLLWLTKTATMETMYKIACETELEEEMLPLLKNEDFDEALSAIFRSGTRCPSWEEACLAGMELAVSEDPRFSRQAAFVAGIVVGIWNPLFSAFTAPLMKYAVKSKFATLQACSILEKVYERVQERFKAADEDENPFCDPRDWTQFKNKHFSSLNANSLRYLNLDSFRTLFIPSSHLFILTAQIFDEDSVFYALPRELVVEILTMIFRLPRSSKGPSA